MYEWGFNCVKMYVFYVCGEYAFIIIVKKHHVQSMVDEMSKFPERGYTYYFILLRF